MQHVFQHFLESIYFQALIWINFFVPQKCVDIFCEKNPSWFLVPCGPGYFWWPVLHRFVGTVFSEPLAKEPTVNASTSESQKAKMHRAADVGHVGLWRPPYWNFGETCLRLHRGLRKPSACVQVDLERTYIPPFAAKTNWTTKPNISWRDLHTKFFTTNTLQKTGIKLMTWNV